MHFFSIYITANRGCMGIIYIKGNKGYMGIIDITANDRWPWGAIDLKGNK
jgi:hypothetical protein